MHRYSRLSALWGAFYSRDLYRDVVFRWKGIGLLYLLLLLAICWLPSAGRWFAGLRDYVDGDGKAIVEQLPVITIAGGVMTADPPGRHVILLEDTGDPARDTYLVIDDSIDSVPSDLAVQAVVLTRHEVGQIRPSRGERRVWTLAPSLEMTVTHAGADAFLRSLAFWAPPAGYLGAVAGSLVFRMLQALLYGALAIAYARRLGLNLSYASAVRVAAVAITPIVVIATLLGLGPGVPVWYVGWPLAILMTLAYIRFGIRAAVAPADVPAVVPGA